jgi:hypothetical protein
LTLCPETAGTACVGAVVAAAATVIGTGIVILLQKLSFKDDLTHIQTDIRGRFETLRVESTK